MSEPRCPGSRMNRRRAAVLSGALGAAALAVTVLVVTFGTPAAIPLAIAALGACVHHVRRAVIFAGPHLRLLVRPPRPTPFEIL